MRSFTYTITDSVGIHARPAGMLAKAAKEYNSEIIIKKGEKSVNVTKVIAVMGMGIKCGDSITVSIEGDDEDIAYNAIEKFFEENL